jgi:xylan 1,4-beta-xylosidase
VRLKNQSPGEYRLTIYRMGYHCNDLYSRFLEMGSPPDLRREAVVVLDDLSSGKPVAETTAP